MSDLKKKLEGKINLNPGNDEMYLNKQQEAETSN